MPQTAETLPAPLPASLSMSRLSLAAKLYSIFALFGLLIAAIAVLSYINTRRNAELTGAVEPPIAPR